MQTKTVLALMLLIIPILMIVQSTQGQTVIFSGPVTLPPTHGVCGQYFFEAFTAGAGTVVYGNLTSNHGVNLYLLTDIGFKAWSRQIVAGGICIPSNPVLIQQNATAYNFTATITSGGKYDIVLNNLSHTSVTSTLAVYSTTA